MMGQDPMGNDEYALFAGLKWTEVQPKAYNGWYDISPANGFSSYSSPHMWNYHLPGFISASLMDEDSCDVLDGFMYFFSRAKPRPSERTSPDDAWWFSDTFSGGYSGAQCDLVIAFLSFIRHHGERHPYEYDWSVQDDECYERWILRRSR